MSENDILLPVVETIDVETALELMHKIAELERKVDMLMQLRAGLKIYLSL